MVVTWIGIIYAFLMSPYFFTKKETDTKLLRIYTWANRIDESILRDFEKQTGIRVYLNYYESAEELLTKLKMMPSMDCDIMLPSSNVIAPMIEAQLIKKIDKSRCPFINTLYSQFLDSSDGLKNDYSIPLYWDVFGIGYNSRMVGDRKVDVDLLFDQTKRVGQQVGMTDEAREAIFLAAQYLHYPLGHLTDDQLRKIRHLLRDQKPWVGAYSDSQQGYFLATETFAVVASDREIICRQMLKHDFIKFALLRSGSMLRIDSIVINATTQKDDMIYEFLNYLFSKQIVLHHAEKYCILPTRKDAFDQLDQKYIGVPNLYPGSSDFNKLILLDLGLTQKEMNDFWIRFKAS